MDVLRKIMAILVYLDTPIICFANSGYDATLFNEGKLQIEY